MGVFDFFKSKFGKNSDYKFAPMMSGMTPIYSQFGQNVYASDVVQQAIASIVFELKKLDPMHVRGIGCDSTPVTGSRLNAILRNPNPIMTTTELIEKTAWLYFLNYNAFVYKTLDERGQLVSLCPLNPESVTFLEDSLGRLFIQFRFRSGLETTIPYDRVIHLKYKYSVNDYMGGNAQGQPDNNALLQTLTLNDELLKGVARSMKASYAVNGVVKYNTMIGADKMEAEIKRLETALAKSESGLMGLDLKGEFIPVMRNVSAVDEATLQFIDSKILRHYGVSLPILTGDYTKEQYDAFYQKTLEPVIKSFSQAFTKVLLSQAERDRGNEIKFYSKELIFMTTDQKLEMIRLLGDSGALYENEKRHAFGLAPLPELQGVRKMSLNYVDVNIANQYQIGDPEPTGDDGGVEEDE